MTSTTGPFTIYQVNLHDPRNKILGVGISNVLKIFGYCLFEGGQDYPPGSFDALSTRNKNIYGLRISTVFNIFRHFLFIWGQDHL